MKKPWSNPDSKLYIHLIQLQRNRYTETILSNYTNNLIRLYPIYDLTRLEKNTRSDQKIWLNQKSDLTEFFHSIKEIRFDSNVFDYTKNPTCPNFLIHQKLDSTQQTQFYQKKTFIILLDYIYWTKMDSLPPVFNQWDSTNFQKTPTNFQIWFLKFGFDHSTGRAYCACTKIWLACSLKKWNRKPLKRLRDICQLSRNIYRSLYYSLLKYYPDIILKETLNRQPCVNWQGGKSWTMLRR